MSKSFWSIDNLSDAYSSMRKGFIASIVINVFTFLLLIFISLMKLGGIPAFSYFHYYHFLILFVGIALSYFMHKEYPFSYLFFFFFLLVDKVLLLLYGLVNPVISLFIFIFLAYFLLRGFQACLRWSRFSEKDRILHISERESFLVQYKDIASSFVLVSVIFISGVVLSNIFVLLGKHYELDLGLFNYPLGAFLTLFLSVLGMYPYFKRLLGTFPLAFANIIVLAFATSLSTLVPQSMSVPFQPSEFYSKAYGYLGHLYIFFSVDKIFYSYWYISLFVLLGLNILRVIFKGKFVLKKLGFYITHFSLIFILLAVWYNYFFSYTGIIPLQEGNMSNKVFLFKESKQKHRVDEKDLDFYIKLDKFETRNWESAYHIYVKKFKKPIPDTLSKKTYDEFSKNLPLQFKGVLSGAYKKEKKLTLSPSLSILSMVGFTFLSTYREGAYHYVLQTDGMKKEVKRMLRRMFLLFGYKGKDITANPIVRGEAERVYGANITYKVLEYFENYKLDYLPIPNEFSSVVFEGKILSSVPEVFGNIAKKAYKKSGDVYVLKDVYKKDANRRDELINVFSSLPDKSALFNNGEVNQSALGFNYLSGSEGQEIWLIHGEDARTNSITLNSGAELEYFWSMEESEARDILSRFTRKILVSGKDKFIYLNRNGKFTKSSLVFDVPFVLEENGYAYFNHILPNYELYHPYKRGISNIPVHISVGDFADKLLGKLESVESKEFLRSKAYMKFDKVWLLNPLFHYDEGERSKIALILKEARFKFEPLNPYLLLELSYEEGGVMKKKLTSLSPSALNVFMFPSSNYTLTFASRRDIETKYWKSDLSVLLPKDEKSFDTVHKEQIQVNEYMYYDGYRFYQTDANKEDKTYSGIGVSIEPGLSYIYLGFITLSLGIIIMFYIPVARKRKK